MRSRRYVVSGKVQGVWYRKHLQAMAREEGFSGYVRNLPDGRVEAAVSCGTEAEFGRFEALLKEGSPLSRVDAIAFEESDGVFEGGFEVR